MLDDDAASTPPAAQMIPLECRKAKGDNLMLVPRITPDAPGMPSLHGRKHAYANAAVTSKNVSA